MSDDIDTKKAFDSADQVIQLLRNADVLGTLDQVTKHRQEAKISGNPAGPEAALPDSIVRQVESLADFTGPDFYAWCARLTAWANGSRETMPAVSPAAGETGACLKPAEKTSGGGIDRRRALQILNQLVATEQEFTGAVKRWQDWTTSVGKESGVFDAVRRKAQENLP